MTAPFEKKMPGPSIRTTVSGHVTLAVGKEDGSSPEVRADFQNMVLDSGLDILLKGLSLVRYCEVGSSAAAVSPEQTALGARIGFTAESGSPVGTVTSVSPHTVQQVYTYRFGAGVAAGNVAEVGFGDSPLFSRALVRDSEGQPTAITVLSDEYLDVTYVLTTVTDLADVPFTMNLSTGPVSGVLRRAKMPLVGPNPSMSAFPVTPGPNATAYLGSIGDVFSEPTGSESADASMSVVASPYVEGSFYLDYTLEMDVGRGNLPGGAFSALHIGHFGSVASYQMSFDPPVPKTAERVFTFGIRLSVGRG